MRMSDAARVRSPSFGLPCSCPWHTPCWPAGQRAARRGMQPRRLGSAAREVEACAGGPGSTLTPAAGVGRAQRLQHGGRWPVADRAAGGSQACAGFLAAGSSACSYHAWAAARIGRQVLRRKQQGSAREHTCAARTLLTDLWLQCSLLAHRVGCLGPMPLPRGCCTRALGREHRYLPRHLRMVVAVQACGRSRHIWVVLGAVPHPCTACAAATPHNGDGLRLPALGSCVE